MTEIDTDISNPNIMYEMCEYLALVRIDSIDGGSNVSLNTGDYVYPYTYGKMTVLQVYKGEIEFGLQLDYIRMGGIVSFEEYLNGLLPNQREKILTNMEKNQSMLSKRLKKILKLKWVSII